MPTKVDDPDSCPPPLPPVTTLLVPGPGEAYPPPSYMRQMGQAFPAVQEVSMSQMMSDEGFADDEAEDDDEEADDVVCLDDQLPYSQY